MADIEKIIYMLNANYNVSLIHHDHVNQTRVPFEFDASKYKNPVSNSKSATSNPSKNKANDNIISEKSSKVAKSTLKSRKTPQYK